MLFRSYGTVTEHGTMFVGFAADQGPLSRMLDRMAGLVGPRDQVEAAIESFHELRLGCSARHGGQWGLGPRSGTAESASSLNTLTWRVSQSLGLGIVNAFDGAFFALFLRSGKPGSGPAVPH